jgi:hypothetical protein
MANAPQQVLDTLQQRLREFSDPRVDKTDRMANLRQAITEAEMAAPRVTERYLQKELYGYTEFAKKTLEQAARR